MPQPLPGQAPLYSGMMDCVRQTIKTEGPAAFYKGTVPPLLGVGLCVAIQFAAVEQVKAYFRAQDKTGEGKLSWSQHYLAGAAAGVANSIVSGPVEHLRTRMQVQRGGSGAYAGPLDAARKIFAQHGMRGIYKGQLVTVLRCAPPPSPLRTIPFFCWRCADPHSVSSRATAPTFSATSTL